MPITVNIKCSTGTNFSVETDENTSVGEFKQKLVEKSQIPVEKQRLIYSGHVLKDFETLASYSVKDGHTVHLVRGASNNTSSQGSTGPSVSTPQPSDTTNTTPSFPSLGSGGFGFGAPNMQQILQNPNMMRDIMNSPVTQSMLQNPELMRTLLLSNPQMREVIERNPEVGHILNDPQILRQTLEMARNPELMREMMRNTDRAMSNIESHPEGFNLLRRMYTNVQEPLMNPPPQTNNPFSALFGNNSTGANTQQAPSSTPPTNPNTAPLPNPWGPSPSTPNPPSSPSSSSSSSSNTTAPNPSPFALDPSMIDPNVMSSMLQNPGVQNMMQQMFSNPELMQQMMNSNPLLSNLANQNPMARQMLQNPDILRQMSDPNTINALLQMQSAMQQLQGSPLGNLINPFGQPPTSGTSQGSNPLDFFSMMQGAQPTTTPPQNPQLPPEERFKVQLEQLKDMGFFDQQANIRALEETGGNVQLAVERLLSQ